MFSLEVENTNDTLQNYCAGALAARRPEPGAPRPRPLRVLGLPQVDVMENLQFPSAFYTDFGYVFIEISGISPFFAAQGELEKKKEDFFHKRLQSLLTL